MTVYGKLQALLTAANTKTGESDTDLTSAVQTLIDGYGQGGGISITTATTASIKNERSSGSFVADVIYNAGGWLSANRSTLSNGSTSNIPNIAIFDDGINNKFIVIRVNYNLSAIKYNGADVPFTKAGTSGNWACHIELPAGFDGTYPFVFS